MDERAVVVNATLISSKSNMFICSNYLFGILIVIGYWITSSYARPQRRETMQDLSKSVHPLNSSVTFVSETEQGAQPSNHNDVLSKKGLTRILSHQANPSRQSSVEEEDEDYSLVQEIIFPDSYEEILEPIVPVNDPPKCAEDNTFCENIETYPYQHLKELLRKSDVPKAYFGVDEAPDEIANRLGEPEENFICESIERTIYPQIGKTKNQKWKYIVNQGDHGYVQGVRVETCRTKSEPCQLIGNTLPNGYVTSCKQKYVYRRLLSVTDEGRRTVKDTFQIPSACCCSYKKNPYFFTNFRSPATPLIRRMRSISD